MSVPRLHPDTIEAVRQAADIVDVVSEHVVLKKQGRGFSGCCPFHDDKSPSFSVSPEKQFYHCFGCGAGGNVFKFLMEIQQRPFAEVVLDLAQRYQVPVQTLEQEERQSLQRQLTLREQLYDVLALATRFYQQALTQPQGKGALAYAQHERGLSQQTLLHFQIGYAPDGWQTLYEALVQQKRIPATLVEQAGLIVPRRQGEGYYDRFRDRLMIPIHDTQGRVVGFGSRTLTGEEPKYLNSPETELFNKRKLLFGLDKARKSIVQEDRAIVVEGYFDVIALHAAGIENAVGSMGTALTRDQVRLLLRYSESKQVVLNFDADAAGSKAAERAIAEVEDLAYRGDVQLRILNLPNGKDADEYLQAYSADDYFALLEEAPLWVDWQIEAAIRRQDLSQADQFQQASQDIAAILGKLPNAALRTHYVHQCAQLLSQGDPRMTLQLEEALLTQVRGQRWHGRSQKWQRPADYTLREAAEEQLLRIYLHCPEVRFEVRDALRQRDVEFCLSHHRFLWREILAIEQEFSQIPVDLGDQIHPELAILPEAFDLVAVLWDLGTKFPTEVQQIQHLLYLDERAQLDILRPKLAIQAASASLERIICEKRCRHLLNMWDAAVRTAKQSWPETPLFTAYLQNILTEETEHISALLVEEHGCLQELEELKRLYYQEKQYLQQLDQQRRFSMRDLTTLMDDDRLFLN
ncbi:DNA primase [Lyngbya confervoides]|uniref:DNA primase n=1 Tax=Lyngbya confervoides BDU141951 TaxID=1574623 RepID=A0ABD4T1X7_9CYAN|nr:DNA primase [Lyngbya confervoides]MCM1982534.1 DNA primase [Lyngbya confervoides BDU141951]